jgi:hypothetical protein
MMNEGNNTNQEGIMSDETALAVMASEIIDEEFGHGITEDDVVMTRDTLQNFIDQWGDPQATNEGDGWTGAEWNRLQQVKGQPRFDLVVIDFGEWRGCYKG